jgi:hypothetical protein
MKKISLILIVLIFTLIGTILHPKVRFYLETVERYRSKEVCSCHLSLKRDLELCEKDWRVIKWYPFFTSIDDYQQSITVGIFRKTSVLLPASNGCRLIN